MLTIDYDHIPRKTLGKKILEIGPGSGEIQLASRHKKVFQESQWVGIEKRKYYSTPYLHVRSEIEVFSCSQYRNKFDTIIMSHVLEHIDIRNWEAVLRKLKSCLIPGGYLIVIVPYLENAASSYRFYDYHDHSVYMIDRDLIRYFLPGAKITTFNRWVFREQDERRLWAFFRYIKRLLTQHYFVQKLLPRRINLMAVWKKERSDIADFLVEMKSNVGIGDP